ncbi:translation initiation factor IF-2 [Candidatus Roizmanbacteria bacterium CG_4_10_14_0_2_um_filter_36_35]|uniref:Translation initiation factor IF-2 n=4 Tax=Candidatus Roizmaniibacteriota TaxID=1752723 RepID=A0A2M7BVU1_9BACT|nr:translation initiation factor IF-2 [Candidatus Roizmanbacteria bacterium]PIQ72448.1 MAG: translation initiation factor IF-2 [Candidatus Roizmanbacteria bacterium CG11_big_fil_rev_8_21_14_0_20_35_14]PIV10687.1 MAG: translation initiation factor IF-2 [Candidatus Roizmanbacteria bacterium CG03_land_8_20_14_0_80_35_26]PIZ68017.1 MAG: translation initiation factor IF-2 [Candidatus Roizmanbacteria bacterium CG_4_10_14_0_2_um_filter_36_35]PJC33411.1 MAG: translation initiation factor IF-2 [Candidat
MNPRPPIVTILGHVDHGKTTLLDYIRKTNIAEGEYGGITQKIGAYEIVTNFKDYKTNKITFIDTPGHEAFSLLRARGANVSDIALLLIDGKDSVMPQTAESISHINAAKIPFIVVINKIDLSETNPEKVKNDLLKYQVMVEGKGGHVPVVLVSAKTGKGIKELLEAILLISADLNLTYDETRLPQAYIIETKKDRRGIVVSAVIKDGKIKTGDVLYSQDKKIKVRSIYNDRGQTISEAIPSTPFELLGFSELPEVGSTIQSQQNNQLAPLVPTKLKEVGSQKQFNLEAILNTAPKEKKLSIIIKTDSQGSLEAIQGSIKDNKDIEVILQAVGEINKSDIFLAKATKSIIIGFSVSPSAEAKDLAKQEKVIIKTYQIIYELLDEISEVASLIKEKEEKEKNLKGEAKILANFTIENEIIFGVKIIKGKINLGDQLETFRENKLIGKTKLVSLKIRAKVVSEVKKGQEAGMMFYPKLDIRIGDVVKSIL